MNPSIPQEIVIQIFSWLPPKSLMRFKCVTKFLNSAVSETYFRDIHTSHFVTRQGVKYVLDARKFHYTADHQKEDGKISAVLQNRSFDELSFNIPIGSWFNCVNGLFCIWIPSRSKPPAAILNPTTGDVRFLPELDDELCMLYYWLGFDPEENKYKVLSTRYNISEQYLKHWIFTLGIDESWRETQSTPSPAMCKQGVCINGVIYRFVYHDGIAINAFDVKSESSKLIAWKASKWYYYELIEVKGQLAVIDYVRWSREEIHLWVFTQIQEGEEWESHIILFPSMWKDISQKVTPEIILTCMSGDEEILFLLNLKSGVFCSCYDVTRKSWRKLEINGLTTKRPIRGIYSYIERLVNVETNSLSF